MGANAQTTVPTFTAGQVLTADQQNQSARTGVPVFSTTGTRDAAFGGTGEKTLAEGQMCYVEGTGFQTYNGTSWVTWGTAPSTGALTLIKTQTIGSAVSSVQVTDAFSSTYDNYKILITGGTASTNNWLGIQLGATTTGYYWGAPAANYTNGAYSGGAGNNSAGFDNMTYTAGSNGFNLNCEIYSPNLAQRTAIGWWHQLLLSGQGAGAGAGFVDNNTQYTAFTLLVAAGSITGGTIRVYGYANS